MGGGGRRRECRYTTYIGLNPFYYLLPSTLCSRLCLYFMCLALYTRVPQYTIRRDSMRDDRNDARYEIAFSHRGIIIIIPFWSPCIHDVRFTVTRSVSSPGLNLRPIYLCAHDECRRFRVVRRTIIDAQSLKWKQNKRAEQDAKTEQCFFAGRKCNFNVRFSNSNNAFTAPLSLLEQGETRYINVKFKRLINIFFNSMRLFYELKKKIL